MTTLNDSAYITKTTIEDHSITSLIFVYTVSWASLVAQRLKCLLAMWETWVRSLSREDPLKKERATHCSILAWQIPQTEESGRLESNGVMKELDKT